MQQATYEQFDFQSILEFHLDDIISQQGFLKNKDDVKAVIKYIRRSFVPRKFLSDTKNFKPAQKLLCSLKKYIEKFFNYKCPISIKRYQNIWHDYTFLGKKLVFTPAREILEVNAPGELPPTYFKKKYPIDFFKDNEVMDEPSKKRFLIQAQLGVRRKIVSNFTHGRKYVGRDSYVRPVLKKKYKNKKDLRDDLYKIFINWYLKKEDANEVFVHVRSEMIENGISSGYLPTEKAWRKYFLTREMFEKFMDEAKYPKRYSRILGFCLAAEKKKSIKLNTVSESILKEIVTHDKEKGSNIFKVKPTKELYHMRVNAKWCIFIDHLTKDLCRRGYLHRYEATALSYFNSRKDQTLVYSKPKGRKFQGQKKAILNMVLRDYLHIRLELLKDKFDRISDIFNNAGPVENRSFNDIMDFLRKTQILMDDDLIAKEKAAIENQLSKAKKELKTKDPLFIMKLVNNLMHMGFLKEEDMKIASTVGLNIANNADVGWELAKHFQKKEPFGEPNMLELPDATFRTTLWERLLKHYQTCKCDFEFCRSARNIVTDIINRVKDKKIRKNLKYDHGYIVNSIRRSREAMGIYVKDEEDSS
jgi:hypothetical protein